MRLNDQIPELPPAPADAPPEPEAVETEVQKVIAALRALDWKAAEARGEPI